MWIWGWGACWCSPSMLTQAHHTGLEGRDLRQVSFGHQEGAGRVTILPDVFSEWPQFCHWCCWLGAYFDLWLHFLLLQWLQQLLNFHLSPTTLSLTPSHRKSRISWFFIINFFLVAVSQISICLVPSSQYSYTCSE